MKNYIQPGNNVTITAGADITSGQLIVVGSLIGVACTSAANGSEVDIATVGVYELPKAAADDISAGDLLYWDAGNAVLTKVAGGGSKPLVGAAAKSAGAAVTTVYCKLGVHGLTGPA